MNSPAARCIRTWAVSQNHWIVYASWLAVEDHVHLLGRFAWQGGYADFSVSESNLKQEKQYIADQVPHRRKMSFPDELRALLRKHRIE